MFSQAAIYLRDVLALTRDVKVQPDYYAARQLLQAALSEVVNDPDQPIRLKQLARRQIEQAVAYILRQTESDASAVDDDDPSDFAFP